jgi:hypothetical protein
MNNRSKRTGNAVARKYKPRKNYILHVTLGCILIAGVFSVLAVTVLFNTRNLIVTNVGAAAVYTDEQVLAAGEIEVGVNLMRFDHTAAQSNIKHGLVQLDDVSVQRQFPSTIEVIIENAETMFSVYDGKMYFSVSRNGRITDSEKIRPDGIVVTGFSQGDISDTDETDNGIIAKPLSVGDKLICTDIRSSADNERGMLAFRLVELLETHDFAVLTIDLSDRFDVKLYYCDNDSDKGSGSVGGVGGGGSVGVPRLELRFGTPTQLEQKLIIAMYVIENHIESSERGTLRVTTLRRATFTPML